MVRHGAAILAALLTLGTSACGADPPDPTPSPPATSSPTPSSPTPTPTEPPLPAAAKANTAKGATKFVKYYIDLLNYAANTGHVKPLRANSHHCGGCDDYVQLYRGIYKRGGFFHTDGWEPTGANWSRQGKSFGVIVAVDAPSVAYRMKKGSQKIVSRSHRYTLLFTVVHKHGAWTVISLLDGSE